MATYSSDMITGTSDFEKLYVNTNAAFTKNSKGGNGILTGVASTGAQLGAGEVEELIGGKNSDHLQGLPAHPMKARGRHRVSFTWTSQLATPNNLMKREPRSRSDFPFATGVAISLSIAPIGNTGGTRLTAAVKL